MSSHVVMIMLASFSFGKVVIEGRQQKPKERRILRTVIRELLGSSGVFLIA
jgi:hypothetical protein